MSEGFDLSVLSGKVAVVTGSANYGIGWGLAEHCAGLGMHVAIVDLNEQLSQSAAKTLTDQMQGKIKAVGIQADVTSVESMQRCLEQVQSNFPGINIGAVFANAGVIFLNANVLSGPMEDWDITMNVNVRGVLVTDRTFAPVLQKQDTKSIIVNTASTAAVVYGAGSYGVSKHACLAITESLHDELDRRKQTDKISVHVLCPGVVQSALYATTRNNKQVAQGKGQAREARKPEEQTAYMNGMGMTTERHAQQVFDRIARGEFYIVTDNARPYVDHDFNMGSEQLIEERTNDMRSRKITPTRKRYRSPMTLEQARREKERTAAGAARPTVAGVKTSKL